MNNIMKMTALGLSLFVALISFAATCFLLASNIEAGSTNSFLWVAPWISFVVFVASLCGIISIQHNHRSVGE